MQPVFCARVRGLRSGSALPGATDAVNYYFHDKDRRGSAAEWNSTGCTVINASDDNRDADLIETRVDCDREINARETHRWTQIREKSQRAVFFSLSHKRGSCLRRTRRTLTANYYIASVDERWTSRGRSGESSGGPGRTREQRER